MQLVEEKERKKSKIENFEKTVKFEKKAQMARNGGKYLSVTFIAEHETKIITTPKKRGRTCNWSHRKHPRRWGDISTTRRRKGEKKIENRKFEKNCEVQKRETKWPGTEANISASPSLLNLKPKSLQPPRRGEEHAISLIENIQGVGEI